MAPGLWGEMGYTEAGTSPLDEVAGTGAGALVTT